MMELEVTLDFPCCICDQPVAVTVKCEGNSLWDNARSVGKVIVPCPNCNHLIHLSFEPCGRVCDVVPYKAPRGMLEPCWN